MRTLMSEPAWVHYAQFYVESSESYAGLRDCFAGQRNGLCGAAVPGMLFLITGLHTGKVGFTVELHEKMPSVDYSAEEVVEAPYRPLGDVALVGWGGSGRWALDLEQVNYRVRYCGWGMDAGHQAGPPIDGEPLVDRYLLQFWPAPPAPERVIKETSAQAAYWHREARKVPPPPTPEQRAELQRERERKHAEEFLAELTREWGGTLPSERVRDACRKAFGLVELDRPLIDDIGRADPDTQRAIARWSARRACVELRLDEVDWIATILDGMDRGSDMWSLLPATAESATGTQESTLVFRQWGWIDGADPMENFWSVVMAADDEDPLRAAFETVWLASCAFDDARDLIRELRQAFPVMSPGG